MRATVLILSLHCVVFSFTGLSVFIYFL